MKTLKVIFVSCLVSLFNFNARGSVISDTNGFSTNGTTILHKPAPKTINADTQFVKIGETLPNGKVFHEIGEFVESEDESEQEFKHHIFVLPNPQVDKRGHIHYYVKENGDGDGSSWANAMGNKAFSFSFDKVESGSSFHIAEGVYTPVYGSYEDLPCFWTQTPVNIVGGYSSDPSEGEVANPKKHVTIFEGNAYGIVYEIPWGDTVKVSGIKFRCSTSSKISVYVSENSKNFVLSVDKCTFDSVAGLYVSGKWIDVDVKNCTFSNYPSLIMGSLSCLGVNRLNVSSSTFRNNYCSSYLSDVENSVFTNCTFADVIFSFNGRNLSLINNTMLSSNLFLNGGNGGDDELYLEGNIFLKSFSVGDYSVKSYANLISDGVEITWKNSKSDILAPEENIKKILDYTVDVPNFADNGGFTKTVSVWSDFLNEDDISIRFDRGAGSNIDVDQRGKKREAKTCMGAYESGLADEIVYLSDTIVYPGSYNDYAHRVKDLNLGIGNYVRRDTVGGDGVIYKNIIYVRNITVLPKGTADKSNKLHYYVKENGNGDGSSWASPMNKKDFAAAFSMVDEGATFHIAEGVYSPTKEGVLRDVPGMYSSKTFCNFSPINIIGGYSKDAKDDSDEPDTSHHTIFKGEYVDVEGTNVLPRNLIYMRFLTPGHCTIKGIEFESNAPYNSYTSAVLFETDGKVPATFTMENCKFNQTHGGVMTYKCSGSIINCNIEQSSMSPLYLDGMSDDTFKVESSYIAGIMRVSDYNYVVENSTVEEISDIANEKRLHVVENSTVGAMELSEGNTYFLRSNIIYDTLRIMGEVLKESIMASYNIYPFTSYIDAMSVNQGNLALTDYELTKIMENSENRYLAKNNGGFTKTIKILTDVISNNTTFRVPRGLGYDQTGKARHLMTCPGAYELSGVLELTEFPDTTIFANQTIGDQKFTKVGENVWESERINQEDGHRIVKRRNVNVLPNPDKKKNYYVKPDGEGDGSSWASAMGNDAFAFSIDKVEDGSTFHFAAGTYEPVYVNYNGGMGYSFSSFWTDKSVNLVGGYPANPSEGALPHPEKSDCRTLFTGEYCSVVFEPASADTIKVSGIKFWSPNMMVRAAAGCPFIVKGGDQGAVVSVDKCIFDSSLYAMNLTNADMIISNCHFHDLKTAEFGRVIHSTGKCSFKISSTLFDHNTTILDNSGFESVAFTNCTFLENKSFGGTGLSLNGTISMIHNTIFDGLLITGGETTEALVEGNICVGGMDVAEGCKVTSSHNLYSTEFLTNWQPNMDDFAPIEVVKSLFSYTEDGVPNLADNGGFTSTVALLKDTLSKDMSIRYNHVGVTDVDVAQRGVVRPDSTCKGAFEANLEYLIVRLPDTTALAGLYMDAPHGSSTVKLTIGTSVWRDTVRNGKEDVSDTIYVRNITVLPKGIMQEQGDVHYYVKPDGEGDGSSWASAMGNDAFAFSIDKVEDGSTFHFAAGTYEPVYVNYNGGMGYSFSSFWTDKSVNLVGGYPANPSEGALPHPEKSDCRTLFTGEYCSVVFEPASADTIKVSGIKFWSPNMMVRAAAGCPFIVKGGDQGAVVSVDKCIFDSSLYAMNLTNADMIISNCHFHDLKTAEFGRVIHSTGKCSFKISSTLFDHNTTILDNSGFESVAFTNCTFLENKSFGGTGLSLNGTISMIHNTIFDGLLITGGETTEALVEGNICVGGIDVAEGCKVTSSHNLYSTGPSSSWQSSDDSFFDKEVLEKLYPYTKDSVPELANNGGFTQTVELLSDTLSNGKSIRYNHTGVTDVNVDQRGKARPDSTCMGAYEVWLQNVVVSLPDTVVLTGLYEDPIYGGSIMNLSVGTVIWCDTVLAGKEGLWDTVFTRNIIVKPRGTKDEKGTVHYYVKTDGKGDGSSWEYAMGNDAFAFAIDKVDNGSVFHFAAGTYKPVYANYNLYGNKLLCYWTDKCVSLVGGYSANPSEGETPHPGLPETKVNFVGDYYALVFQPIVSGAISLYGIDFTVSNLDEVDLWGDAVVVNGGMNDVSVSIEKCSFHSCLNGLSLTNVSSDINDCYFYDNKNMDNGAIYFKGKELNVKSSLFKENTFVVYGKGNVSMSNCTFLGNTFGVDIADTLLFVNNTVFDNLSILGLNLVSDIIGNLCVDGLDVENVGGITSSYNILSDDETYSWSSKKDTIVSGKMLKDVLAYEGDDPLLADNGGFTQCVALLSDTLTDGTSLRFIRTGVTNVKVDQRGKTRPDSTCVGSFEFGFTKIHIRLGDTTAYAGIYKDERHGGNSSTLKIGTTSWCDTVFRQQEDGYDTIFTRKIIVLPRGIMDAEGNYHYYVKENGAGDGSSWDAAMGSSAFAFAFDKVENNATFHIAEGIYYPITSIDGTRVYRSDKLVNLVGGYSALTTNENVVRNISSYSTKLTGNYGSLSKVVELNLPSQGEAKFCGIVFEEVGASKNGDEAALMITSNGATFTLDSCTFNRAKCGVIVNGCSGIISNCSFTGTESYGESDEEPLWVDDGIIFRNPKGEILQIISSSFIKDKKCIDGCGSLILKNSTIAQSGEEAIVSHIYLNNDAKYVMENNTILSGGIAFFEGYEYSLVGNIVGSTLGLSNGSITSSHNVFVAGTSAILSQSGNMGLAADEFVSLFDGGSSYTLTKAKNGTYYVGLVIDELPSGSSIRFPLSETSVEIDQRGAKRHSLCCAGAYELGCPSITHLYDDLVVHMGEKLKDEEKKIDTTFSSIGRYEWTNTYASGKDAECMEDYAYVVSVLPNPMKDEMGGLHYYVKENGKGDGSSWENAMGSAAFAYSIDKVEDGSTFHIAEGVYNPIYDGPGYANSDNRSAKSFYTTKLVNIIGGYSKDEKDLAALPDSSHHTIFEGAEDNLVSGIHTSVHVLSYCPTSNGHFSVENIDFRKSVGYRSTYGIVRIAPEEDVNVDFSFNHCNFYDCEGGIVSQNCGGSLRYCQFECKNGRQSVLFTGTAQDSVVIEYSYLGTGCSISDYNYRITNSTIYRLIEENGNDASINGLVENSTIVGLEAGASRSRTFNGNIFYGGIQFIGNAEMNTTSSYNIYPVEVTLSFIDKETDMWLEQNDYFFLLENDSSTLVSAKNGGYTKTIALKSELLPDERSIRYIRNGVTTAEKDQRGVQRPVYTCRGAYEFGCIPDTTKIDGRTRTYVAGRIPGRYSDTTSLIGPNGCPSEIITSYMMLPPDSTVCYVTVEGANSMTGADWDNAMSAELFAYSLLYAENTRVYHLAEGMYVPLLDKEGNIPTDLSKRLFYTNRAVSMYGGYTNRAKEGYVQNLKENFTCLGDTLKKNQDNVFLAEISSNTADTIYLNGIEFSSAKKSVQNPGSGEGAAVVVKASNNGFVTRIENCTFTNSNDGLFVEKGTQIISNANFTDNSHAGIALQGSYKGEIRIESSSFLRNGCGFLGDIDSGKCVVRNSTFYNRKASIDLSGSHADSVYLLMEYNTVWGDTLNMSDLTFAGKGNIFGSVMKAKGWSIDEGDLSYNLCLDSYDRNDFKGNNWFISKDEFLSVLDLNESYQPLLWNKNGDCYTSLIKLKADTSSENILLRLPVLQQGDKDQSGSSRLLLTCPGSYELWVIHDTVNVGESKYGITFSQIGISKMEKDGIKYEVVVRPNLSLKSYYVKTNGEGDGSSWAKAMGSSDFEWFFPQAKDGSTFHVAEGTYSFSDNLSTDKLLNIIGGYPENITDVSVSADPVSYVESTIFKGTSNGYIISFSQCNSGAVSISGLSFEDGDGHVSVASASAHLSLVLENCRFANASQRALSIDSSSANIRGCLFENDSVGISFAGRANDSLSLYSVTFSGSSVGVSVQDSPSSVRISNSTFLGDDALSVDFKDASSTSRCYLYNNTIMDGLFIPSAGSHELIGNIFGAPVSVKSVSNSDKVSVESRYNVYLESSKNGEDWDNSTDIVVHDDTLRAVFGVDPSGSYELSPCGITKVLVLADDVLPSGVSLRFSLTEAMVTDDQCGKTRKPRTCRGAYELTKRVSEMKIPTTFTPYTVDGKNDFFMIDYEVYIYDRYGHLVTHSMNGWDGTYSGEMADPGVYIYVLIDPEGGNRKGTVELYKVK